MRARLHLRVSPGRVSAKAVRRHRIVWAGEATFTNPDELREAIRQLVAEESPSVRLRSLQVKLEKPLVQLRTLEALPPVRAAALRAIVEQQAGRFFRRNGTALVTNAGWVSSGPDKKRVVRAVAAEQPWIEAITAGARAAGLPLDGIWPAVDGVPRTLCLSLPSEQARQWKEQLVQLRRLTMVAGVLWVAAIASFALRLKRERLTIDRELSDLRQSALAVEEAQRQVGAAARMVAIIDSAEGSRALLLRRIAAVTAALPESAYLGSLKLDERGAVLSGWASAATEVSAGLERAGMFAAPRLAGPARRELQGGRELERFTVEFGWRP